MSRTIAQDWQLAVLKRVSENPSEDELLAAATETGLGEKWVKNWFRRSRRTRRDAPRQPRAPAFKVQPSPSASAPAPPHTTATPTYPRDPLSNRYPDFSQFFLPQAHTLELSAPDNRHAPVRFLDLPNPPLLGGPPARPSSSPCPVAFSMRLVDLLGHPSLAAYPVSLVQ